MQKKKALNNIAKVIYDGYCRKGTSELKIAEILFLIIVANAFNRSNASTRNSLIVLESCVPYTVHIQRLENGLNIIVLIEVNFFIASSNSFARRFNKPLFSQAGLSRIANDLHSLLLSLTSTSSSVPDDIPKRIGKVQKLAIKLGQPQWSETLSNWRAGNEQNQSAVSALARQIQYGYELICLSPALLFSAVEHVSAVIDRILVSIPMAKLAQPCLLAPILQLYPGLVHFVLLDRTHHRMISPILQLDKKDSTFDDV